ncbi:adenylate kinase [Metamycoplasma auris]|uniref:Adenylate kinase n=1 Tax=Metamycoplasma auris TaxID=51363 RepID=A0A2W7G5U5_9BACT|nr:adenylate kinase [Metamycoplasma auris]PZW01627.1 adenylate kinase [Metamycoplasma auris]
MIDKCSSCKNQTCNIKPNLIFMGPPGAGKGSISKLMVEKFGYFQLSTGDMFRQEIKNETELGKKIKDILDSGKYVDDSITNQLVESRLSNLVQSNTPFILDGFPRTLDQAEFLEDLEKKGIFIDKVILLNISNEQIIERLSKRRICPKCKTIYHLEVFPPLENKYCKVCHTEVIKRVDDEEEVILKRLEMYYSQTACLIDFYKKKNIVLEINSHQDLKEVFLDLMRVLGW